MPCTPPPGGVEAEQMPGRPFELPITEGDTAEVEIAGSGDTPAVVAMRVAEMDWEGEAAHIVSEEVSQVPGLYCQVVQYLCQGASGLLTHMLDIAVFVASELCYCVLDTGSYNISNHLLLPPG